MIPRPEEAPDCARYVLERLYMLDCLKKDASITGQVQRFFGLIFAGLEAYEIMHCPNCHTEYNIRWVRAWLKRWERCWRCGARATPATEEQLDRIIMLK